MAKKSAGAEGFDVVMASLPDRIRGKLAAKNPLAPARAATADDAADAYDAAVLALPGRVAAALTKPVTPGDPPAEGVGRYGVVEAADGEWMQLRVYKTPEGLARRLQALDGTDVVVCCFYGIPLGVTKGPPRHVALPDGEHMIQVPTFPGGPAKVVPVAEVDDTTLQADGFLGPPELAQVVPQPAAAD